MEREELVQAFKDITDYLAPLQNPYEQAIYRYLFRWSHLETGNNTVRKGKRTIASGCGLASPIGGRGKGKMSYHAVDTNIKNLQRKGHIKVRDTTREGTLYTIFLPMEINECVELKKQKEALEAIHSVDYFTTLEDRMKIFERDNYTCFCCKAKVTKDNATLHHIKPRSKDGDNSAENLVTCCLKCNSIIGERGLKEAALDLLLKQEMKEP